MLDRARLVLIAALMAPALLPGVSAAETPSGTTQKVARAAEATGVAGARQLDVQAPVYMGDRISTNRSGEAQILFLDDTRFVVGPNARVTIDKFVFSGGTARQVTLDAVKGAFRFITGNGPKSAYLIRTPVMTIGVRGTGLDGFVEPGTGRTTVALYEGAAELCDASNQCRTIQAGCTIVVVPPGGGFEAPTPATRALHLPYSISQASLLPQFRLDTSACRGATTPAAAPPDSGGGAGIGGTGASGQRGDPDTGGQSQ